MCINSFNNDSINHNFTSEEYMILKYIYKAIESNNIDEVKELTRNLITLQNSEKKIDTLKQAINILI